MEKETFFTGFCRNQDATRMGTVEYEEGKDGVTLQEVDCDYETCIHRGACRVGLSIDRLLGKQID